MAFRVLKAADLILHQTIIMMQYDSNLSILLSITEFFSWGGIRSLIVNRVYIAVD